MMGVPITGRPIIYLNAYHKNNEGFNLHISFLGQNSGSVLAVQKTPISCPSLMNMSNSKKTSMLIVDPPWEIK